MISHLRLHIAHVSNGKPQPLIAISSGFHDFVECFFCPRCVSCAVVRFHLNADFLEHRGW